MFDSKRRVSYKKISLSLCFIFYNKNWQTNKHFHKNDNNDGWWRNLSENARVTCRNEDGVDVMYYSVGGADISLSHVGAWVQGHAVWNTW